MHLLRVLIIPIFLILVGCGCGIRGVKLTPLTPDPAREKVAARFEAAFWILSLIGASMIERAFVAQAF